MSGPNGSHLSQEQQAVATAPLDQRLFLEGEAGTGKTTAGVARLLHLLQAGVPGDSILVLVPQRTLAQPYVEALKDPHLPPGAPVTVLTVGGLARRLVELFWPLVGEAAGFARPDLAPVFLTLETAQYYMARVVRPLREQGYFEGVSVDHNRLCSQILDNLNKAAVVGFSHADIGDRLKAAWGGKPEAQARVYDDAQECASRFRAYCLEHNLLDFSLQVELLTRHLWPEPMVRRYLMQPCQHLIADNLEEDTPVAHDLMGELLRHSRSALLIYDLDAGYRRFLGADPESGYALKRLCGQFVVLNRSFVAPPAVQVLGARLAKAMGRRPLLEVGDCRPALSFEQCRYQPQMLDRVAERIASLVHDEGVPAREIVVLAPFLGHALRFSLMERLEGRGVAARSNRPSRALGEEPAARCLLTLATLAHPRWEMPVARPELAQALSQAIEGMDLVRASFLTHIVCRGQDVPLRPFGALGELAQQRITYLLGNRYDHLRQWLEEYAAGQEQELDHFLSRLFGEVLSQAGYGFHRHLDRAEVASNLIESVRKFRWAVGRDDGTSLPQGRCLGQEYIQMVRDGVVAAQYLSGWQEGPQDAVLLAPAYTFLMANRPVSYQFWLDVGSRGWWERLYQPLTHPYVLSRRWPRGRVWTDADEFQVRQEALSRLVQGLLRRCRRQVCFCFTQYDEEGRDELGPLLRAVQRLLRSLQDGSGQPDGG